MSEYNFREIEKKWQKVWEDEKRYSVPNHVKGKENKYILVEFPYPSGIGLHMGHCRSYTAIDAFARKKRLEGYNVLFPFGTDSFGLEAERQAIKEKRLPQEVVARNIATFTRQVKSIGMSIDWDRVISSSDPDYFKWTQWQFIQFFKRGLVSKEETLVNYCPNCGVLANEEVEDGKCCQCHSETVQKTKAQWVFKMTKYGKRLADDLVETDFLEHIKTSQLNWIGKSEGVEVDFELACGGKFSIFTTCIETIYGITFMVLAPESKLVDSLKEHIQNWSEVEAYRKQTAKKSEFERSELNKNKTGVILKGVYAIHPLTNEKIPVYIGDFVIAGYGTGAVMAVPTHDQRDFDFAKNCKIEERIQVIEGKDTSECAFENTEYLKGDYKLINSQEFSGLSVKEAKEEITKKLIALGKGRKKLNFRMRDWIFSRQRYWGEPIPMVYCEKCGWQPVDEKDLPVLLPNVKSYEPNKEGESPLAEIKEFVNTTCPCCGKPAKRETDTMPGWAGSSWYYMRYCDPHNDKEFASFDALKAWLPVDLYNGGNEHTTRHLLYARFWNKVLFDMGISPVNEPFKKRISHGLILGADGKKMSKSAGNGIDPMLMVEKYGADSLRLWMSFIGDYSEAAIWSEDGLKACFKLLTRVWNMQDILKEGDKYSKELEFAVNTAIKKVGEDIESYKFNTAISAIMILVNEIYKVKSINKKEFETLLVILSPFAPHLCEELYTKYFGSMKDAKWPKVDEKALETSEIELPVQVLGKVRGTIVVGKTAKESEVVAKAMENADIKRNVTGEIKKVVYVPGKILNIIF